MNETLYSTRPSLALGFHGCEQSVVNKVITGKEELLASNNDYDWLGPVFLGKTQTVPTNKPLTPNN